MELLSVFSIKTDDISMMREFFVSHRTRRELRVAGTQRNTLFLIDNIKFVLFPSALHSRNN